MKEFISFILKILGEPDLAFLGNISLFFLLNMIASFLLRINVGGFLVSFQLSILFLLTYVFFGVLNIKNSLGAYLAQDFMLFVVIIFTIPFVTTLLVKLLSKTEKGLRTLRYLFLILIAFLVFSAVSSYIIHPDYYH